MQVEEGFFGRYAPQADWTSLPDAVALSSSERSAWWQSPGQFQRVGPDGERPLTGLHLALEPGHLGGVWAEWEGRHFRMAEGDYWVREGELVLEVALRVAVMLEQLGAKVSLVRRSSHPVNPKGFADYWDSAAREFVPSTEISLSGQLSQALAIRDQAIRRAIIIGELAERARLVNESIRPDALISLHINAAPWSSATPRQLVMTDHAHVLVFGCMLPAELAVPRQRERLIAKMTNGSGPIEVCLGEALGKALADATGLPASNYSGDNATRLDGCSDYLWARNLMLLRLVDCPVVMLEPYIANSRSSYPRIQAALRARAHHEPLPENDILIEYADAVVRGVLATYSSGAP